MKVSPSLSGQTWLILGDGVSPVVDEAFEESNCSTQRGTLDDYPDLPGGYDGVYLMLSRKFFRWHRWYFQDLFRQLKGGGTLVVAQNPFLFTSVGSFLSQMKRLFLWWSWSILSRTGANFFRARLLPSQFLENAHSAGFKQGEEGSGSLFSYPILFKKEESAQDSFLESPSGNELKRKFDLYFSDWLDPDNTEDQVIRPKVCKAGELLKKSSDFNVLVLSPHPDDELIGCGGTLIGLARLGARIHVIQMTEGITCLALRDLDDRSKREIRWNEARTVAKRHGFTGHYWSTDKDGSLQADRETKEKLRVLIDEIKPDLMFVPAALDKHPEHQIANQLARLFNVENPAEMRILEYPVWGFLPEASIAVDVSDFYTEMLDSLYSYKTAMKATDYVDRCRVLAAHHGRRYLSGLNRFSEVFWEKT